MKLVRWVAWGCFACAAVMVLAALNEKLWQFYAVVAITAVILGILMLALDRIIELLAQISAAVSPARTIEAVPDIAVTNPTRSLTELDADVARLRATHAATP